MIDIPSPSASNSQQSIAEILETARALFSQGQKDEAIKILRHKSNITTNCSDSLYQLAAVFQELGQWDDALMQYRLLAKNNPSHIVFANMVFARLQKANAILDQQNSTSDAQ